jgi:MerR family transcriptional regulator/heat shock protein HspR
MAGIGREPVYVISVAAKMVDMHPQTLRLYERLGLLKPARHGLNRLYSDNDIARLRQIQRLTQDMGVNLAGVEVILNLLEKIEELQDELEQLRQQRLPVPRERDPGGGRWETQRR